MQTLTALPSLSLASCISTSAWQSAAPRQRLQHNQDALEAPRLLLDTQHLSILHLQQQSPAHSKPGIYQIGQLETKATFS